MRLTAEKIDLIKKAANRALGVPSYGASPVFSKDSEDFSHGLNERVALSNVAPGITYYLSLFTDLSK